MPKPTYVLGTNLSHDGSACMLKDGRVCVAIEKERITRRKHDGFNDSAAIQYCLDAAGIRLEDVSLVVQNTWDGMFARGSGWYRGPRLLNPDMRRAMPAMLRTLLDPMLDLIAPVIAAQAGARRAGQERVSGERSERTLDAPKCSRRMSNRSDGRDPFASGLCAIAKVRLPAEPIAGN